MAPVPLAAAPAAGNADDRAAIAELRTAITAARNDTSVLATRLDAEERASKSGFRVGDTSVRIGGYVKVDAISERTSGGQLASSAITRDFLIPSTIPVGGAPSAWDTDFNARQTRLVLTTATPVGGKTAATHIELDFMVTDGGDERVSNSYVPRMRQAFLTYDGWLVGQAWSTFQDVGALPDSLDFIGATPGTVFVRQAQIRYTKGAVSVALEQPETVLTARGGTRLLPGTDALPDIVVRVAKNGLMLAGIARQLRASDQVLPTGAATAWGFGVSASGKVALDPRTDLRFMATAGRGLGRYIGVNIVNDAAITAAGELSPIATYSGFVALRHLWTDRLRSTVSLAGFKADNPVALTGAGQTDTVWNGLANLIYSPIPKLDIGVEYMRAKRTLESGLSGNLQKVQMSAKVSF